MNRPTNVNEEVARAVKRVAKKAGTHQQIIAAVAMERGLTEDQVAGFVQGGMVFVRAAQRAKDDGHDPLLIARGMIDGDDETPGIARHIADEVVAEVGGEIGCREGCAACCDMHVSALDLEADRIAARIETMPAEQRREILDRIQDAMDRGLPWLDTADRLSLHTSCPLLFDKRCSVYDERPLSCRSWFGFSAERCASNTEKSPFGMLTLIGDVAAYAAWIADGRYRQGGDLIELLADRFGIKGRAENKGVLP